MDVQVHWFLALGVAAICVALAQVFRRAFNPDRCSDQNAKQHVTDDDVDHNAVSSNNCYSGSSQRPNNNKSTKKLTAKQLKQQERRHQNNQNSGVRSKEGSSGFPKPWLYMTAKGHSSTVCDVAFSASGQYLASCSEAGTATTSTAPMKINHNHNSSGNSSSASSPNSSVVGSPRLPANMLQKTSQSSSMRRNARKQQQHNQANRRSSEHSGAMFACGQRKNSSGSTSGSSQCGAIAMSQVKTSNFVTARTMMSQASRASALTPPLKEHIKLNMPEAQLAHILREHYVLRESEMLNWGYPQFDAAAGGVVVYTEVWRDGGVLAASSPATSKTSAAAQSATTFDVNAREFIPASAVAVDGAKTDMIIVNADDGLDDRHQRRDSTSMSGDSGQGSGTASPHSVSTDSGDDDRVSSTGSDCSSSSGRDRQPSVATKRSIRQCLLNVRECGRCRTNFVYNDSSDSLKLGTDCYSHLGKPIRIPDTAQSASRRQNFNGGSIMVYSCCQRSVENAGCQYHRQHVWSGLRTGLNGPFQGFVETSEPDYEAADGNYGVFAMDAEMVYTVNGLELAKITVIGHDGRMVYEKFVKPNARVIDYNTRFSGITEKMLSTRGVRTLPQVQSDLLRLFNARTIIVGHAINNDLRCLKMLHRTVVDTSVVFPHHNGQPYRLSLRSLVKSHLQRDIQMSEDGHCSFEDSRNCLAVLLWHVRRNHTRGNAESTVGC